MTTVRFQLRRDTAANWTSVNPTLGSGEPALETDTGKIKYGDGVTPWNSLPYFSAAPLTLASGVYTPTVTPAANVTGWATYPCQYMRVGSTVSGRIDIQPAAVGDTRLRMTLPIASNLALPGDLAGTFCTNLGTSMQSGVILGQPASDEAILRMYANAAINADNYFHFTYLVI